MLTLSTACFSSPHLTTEAVIAQVREMGFCALEWGLSAVQLDADVMADAVREGRIAVTSVHGLAGFDTGGVEVDIRGGHLGSANPRRREVTIDAMCRTVGLARRLGARAVVVHAGGVTEGTLRRHENRLFDEFMTAGGLTPRLQRKFDHVVEVRRRDVPRYLDRVAEALREIIRREGPFPLGIECRYHYCDIPLIDELQWLFDAVGDPCLGYWHDFGHARMRELLGGTPEMSWLDRYEDRLLGVHVHDMVGIGDHMPPGRGQLDIAAIAARLHGHPCARVMEVSGRFIPDAIADGRRYAESVGMDA